MLFNSIDFAVFLPIVFIIYWFIANKSIKNQNILIVIASYIFYGWWDWRFLSLIILSTGLDFIIGLKLSTSKMQIERRVLLWTSILVNLGFLGFFKYVNFFLDNFISAFSFMGKEIHADSLNIILPVGISFYTFQTLSYSIDVYKGKMKATNDFIAFAAFVSFFPQLVAGPIERATNLIPQFLSNRKFDYSQAVDGMRQILWGLFKKIVIADNCATIANIIFNNSEQHTGSTLLLGAIFFAFQIYGDFSGYSDIAIGTSRLFGFNLMRNFAFPYFSRDIAEFWRRWHISLSTWFRDYLYIPLGGSKGSLFIKVRNTFIIFIVSGFWHGANWTFIAWGALNAIYFLPLLLLNKNRVHTDIISEGKLLPSLKEILSIGTTFLLTTIAWIFFRAENIGHALSILKKIFSVSFFSKPSGAVFIGLGIDHYTLFILVIAFLIIEWIGRNSQFAIEAIPSYLPSYIRYSLYFVLIFSLFWFGGFQQEFIYFQF